MVAVRDPSGVNVLRQPLNHLRIIPLREDTGTGRQHNSVICESHFGESNEITGPIFVGK